NLRETIRHVRIPIIEVDLSRALLPLPFTLQTERNAQAIQRHEQTRETENVGFASEHDHVTRPKLAEGRHTSRIQCRLIKRSIAFEFGVQVTSGKQPPIGDLL